MTTTENIDDMTTAEIQEKFVPGRREPYLVSGTYWQPECQDWAIDGTIDGAPVTITYLFRHEEVNDDDLGLMDWSADRIIDIDTEPDID